MRCWQCGKPNDPAADSCGWCGVWLVELRGDRAPAPLWGLLGLAKRWGTSDDGYREQAVDRASRRSCEHCGGRGRRRRSAWDWMVGPEVERQPRCPNTWL
jgi:hypothetical protein